MYHLGYWTKSTNQWYCGSREQCNHWTAVVPIIPEFGIPNKARISSVLFVQNHVLLNSITKSFEKLHKISNKMFIVSHITGKHVQTMTPMINDFVICPMQRMTLDRLFIYYFINLFINLSIYNLSIYYLPVCLSVHITPRPR